MFESMLRIYQRLQDDESKELFDMRITYLLNHDLDGLLERVYHLYADSKWTSLELEDKITAVNPKGIIIFGCGHDGKMTKKLLELWKYNVAFFCDNHLNGILDGKTILSVKDVVDKYKDYLVVIGSSRYGKEMFIELVQKGFPYTNILLPKYFDVSGIIWASRGKEYFDLFEPQTEEIYVDAGAFDGDTIVAFNQWTHGKYKKIYALEPMNSMYEAMRQKMISENIQGIETFDCAAWSRKEKLRFTENSSASHRSNSGEISVQGIDIDSIVKDEKVTFIKMDIEGSELEALKGAKNTILSNQPRLAICLYHKPMDVIEIPSYIIDLVPEYKLYIRHYGSHLGGTVLYARV